DGIRDFHVTGVQTCALPIFGYIQDAFLIHRCDRYDIKGKDTISGNAKFYVNDLAYRNYLYPGFGYGFGYLVENLVFLELRRAGRSEERRVGKECGSRWGV